ncbi:MAG: hypothetical protein GTO45_25435 [Candidatus Aminicenantes bacterium]|nr:hypothetical protein [Candidatus Aminicenantes bacterium]NIM82091.1 hypothetical protein [Candidatus Aminicenantes bacterium]NIN21485.1 hypothetical protein [Candidatus Aminicenantes bacterium]NIN45297.1 hypothetical protein [Candidatus Aminicenantes bacterium]NIN88114.1 hypothetical protein [Candidatus Aminicenantes bacterium]
MAYRDKATQGHFDLESTESYIRDSMHQIGSIMLEKLLNSDNGGFQGETIPCKNKKGQDHTFKFKEFRNKDLLTVLGPVTVERAYYYDKKCREGFCPKDTQLDIKGTSFSPGMRRIMGRVGAYRPFGLGHEDIKEMAGIEASDKEIERVSYQIGSDVEEYFKDESEQLSTKTNNIIPLENMDIEKMYVLMDGTGVPVVKKEIKNRKGKGENGQAKTREAKLGCVFTQTTLDEKGFPIRDEGSTSYVGFIETAEDFGDRIYAEALSRGLEKAKKVCVIGDGAQWIWNIADFHFPGKLFTWHFIHQRMMKFTG